jgi:transcriptional regulator with XRE-family HTH domain
MLIRAQYDPTIQNKESEAFAATCVQFRIKLPEIQMASGLTKQTIESFKTGTDDLTTKDLWKILNALTPFERTFYNSMMSVQDAAEAAGISMPLLDLQKAQTNSDPLRGAMELTMQVFDINSKAICDAAGYANSNFAAWYKGSRESVTLSTLQKIKTGLSREQRAFMDAIVNALVSMQPEPTSSQLEVRQLNTLLKVA